MMSTPLWQQLVSLVTTDQQKQLLYDKIASLKKEIALREVAKDEFSLQAHEYSKQRDEQQKAIRKIEICIEDLDAQENKKRSEENSIVHHKAITALQKELAIIASARNDYENELLSAWHAYDQLKEKSNLAQKAAETHSTFYNDEILTLRSEIEQLDLAIKKQESDHIKQVEKLPEEWIERYHHMKNRVDNPLVPLYQQSCSACFYHVLPQDLARIERNAILSCRNCYRYLYSDPSGEKENDKATY